jgi:ureidoglycolate hydrolase
MPLKIGRFTHKNIKPYGYIIDSKCAKPQPDGNGWGILLRSKSRGWRIAYLILRKKEIKRLESHPDTLETFEPVKGKAVIALAAQNSPSRFRLFYLDRPVVLKKGVWHGLYTISKETHIKIFENSKVRCVYQKI